MEKMEISSGSAFEAAQESLRKARQRGGGGRNNGGLLSSSSSSKQFRIASMVLLFATLILLYGLSTSDKRNKNLTLPSVDGDNAPTSSLSSSSSSSSENGISTSPPSASPFCDWDCQTPFQGHDTMMHSGEAMCHGQYRFGISNDGIFQWQNCDDEDSRVIVKIKEVVGDGLEQQQQTINDYTWKITKVGRLEIYDDTSSSLIWYKDSKVDKIDFYPQCIDDPPLDCPYLNLRERGDVVLNYYNTGTNTTSGRKIQSCFDDLFKN